MTVQLFGSLEWTVLYKNIQREKNVLQDIIGKNSLYRRLTVICSVFTSNGQCRMTSKGPFKSDIILLSFGPLPNWFYTSNIWALYSLLFCVNLNTLSWPIMVYFYNCDIGWRVVPLDDELSHCMALINIFLYMYLLSIYTKPIDNYRYDNVEKQLVCVLWHVYVLVLNSFKIEWNNICVTEHQYRTQAHPFCKGDKKFRNKIMANSERRWYVFIIYSWIPPKLDMFQVVSSRDADVSCKVW